MDRWALEDQAAQLERVTAQLERVTAQVDQLRVEVIPQLEELRTDVALLLERRADELERSRADDLGD